MTHQTKPTTDGHAYEVAIYIDERRVGFFTWHDESEQLISALNHEAQYMPHRFGDKDEAELFAHDMNEYWTTKGYFRRAQAERIQ